MNEPQHDFRTDFKTWSVENLAKLAQDLRDENFQLRQQVKDLHTALRKEWVGSQPKEQGNA